MSLRCRSHHICHHLLFNGLYDLSGLAVRQVQYDSANSTTKDLARLLFPQAEILNSAHDVSIHDIIGMYRARTWGQRESFGCPRVGRAESREWKSRKGLGTFAAVANVRRQR